MIHYIKGVVTDTEPGLAVIECNGIGYEVFVPDNCSVLFAGRDELVTLFTYMAVREDDVSLYGFTDKESLNMFKMLTTVSGIGNKGAMAILSKLSLRELRQAIAFDDPAAIAKANGIGKKTAAKVVLELKDKIGSVELPEGVSITDTVIVKGTAKDEALMALQALGFSKSEASSYLLGINDENLSAEEYVRLALRARR
jgi:Holliday junction DNA helicase RuvA